jgi:hypothetical protein
MAPFYCCSVIRSLAVEDDQLWGVINIPDVEALKEKTCEPAGAEDNLAD